MADTTKKVFKILKKLNTIWHPESTLVFKSQKDKRAIGRYVDGEFVSFDETALELCSEWDFKYDESLVADGDEESGGEEKEGSGGEESGEKEESGEEGSGEEEVVQPVRVALQQSKKSDSSDVNALLQQFTVSISAVVADIRSQLADKEAENVAQAAKLSKLKEDYDRLNKKFEGIKQLFA